MKVLYLAPDRLGAPKGAGSRIARTVRALGELGCEVEVFGPEPSAEAEPPSNFLERKLSFRRQAAAWLERRGADAVFVRSIWEGLPALAWARRAGARLVFEAHGLPSVELPYHFPSLHEHDDVLAKIAAEERALIMGADRLIVPSRTNARFMRLLGARIERVAVVPNAVDTDIFFPAPEPPPAGPPWRVVYVGTLSPWQGLEFLFEAISRLPNRAAIELIAVGSAKSLWRRRVKALAHRLRIHRQVLLSGPSAQEDLAPILRTAHICAAPLPADARNVLQGCCPVKIVEYMSVGRPILSTAVPPVLEMLEHGKTAHLVEPSSPIALADGLRWLMEHPAEREALGAQARAAALAGWTHERFRENLRSAVADLAGVPA